MAQVIKIPTIFLFQKFYHKIRSQQNLVSRRHLFVHFFSDGIHSYTKKSVLLRFLKGEKKERKKGHFSMSLTKCYRLVHVNSQQWENVVQEKFITKSKSVIGFQHAVNIEGYMRANTRKKINSL